MVKSSQQGYLVTILVTNFFLICSGIQCEYECCYWYGRFPATPSVCHGTNQTRTVSLLCEVKYRSRNNSNKIEVKWYRSRSEEYNGRDREILINEKKYMRYPDRNLTTVNQIFTRQYMLGILRFNNSDRGYYWCQIVVNNVSLSPSPYGYISSPQCTFLEISCSTSSPLCAHNMSAQYIAHTNGSSCSLEDFSNIIPTGTATMSQTVTMSSNTATEAVSVTISSFPTTEVAPDSAIPSSFPITEIVTTIVAGIILFLLIILLVSSIICIKKHNSQSKEHDLIIHQCENLELEEHKDANDISNPHYTEVRIATDHNRCPLTHEGNRLASEISERDDSGSSKTESNLTTQQHPPHSEVWEIAQINDSHRDQIKNQESHRIHRDIVVSSEYAVVNKSKKTTKLQSDGIATKADSALENPQYDKLKQDRHTKDIDTSKEGKDQLDNLREKSPSPEYAELSTREKKVPAVTKYLTEKEKDSKSDSHEYDKVAGGTQGSAKVTNGDTDDSEIEQHYYYTLENPEESCSNSNRKEETTKTISSAEMEYSMPQAHHLVIENVPIVPNTDAKVKLVSIKEINASTLDSQKGEVSTDNT